MSNSQLRCNVLGRYGESIDEDVNFHRLRWLKHRPDHRLPRCIILGGVGVILEKARSIKKRI